MDEQVTVEVVIGNEGNASTTDRTVNYYLSGDADLNTEGDNVKVGDDVFSISASDITESTTFTPSNFDGLNPGEWHVIAEFPSENEFWRFQDQTLTLESGGGGGDLEIPSISFSPNPAQMGEQVTVRAGTENVGNGEFSGDIVYYMSEDQTITTEDVRIGDDSETLDSGESDEEEIQFTPENFSSLSPGEYYVGVIIPSEDEAWYRTSPVELDPAGGADLVARSISWSPDPAQMSEEVTVEVVIGNEGNASATDRTVNYYLSGDADLNTEGDNVKVGDDVFSIGTDDVTESATFTPSNFDGLSPGEWHVIAEFPSENEFWRNPDETITLVQPGDPDIQVSTTSLSFTLPPGGSDTKNFSIENTGDADLDWSINLSGSSAVKTGDVTGKRRGATGEWSKLRAAAKKKGKIPVIVHLDVRVQPEGALSKSAVQTQRAAISQAQESVVDALTQAGAAVEGVRRYNTVPHLALQTDEAGVDALASVPNVKRVVRDKPVPPMLGESISIVGADDTWSAGYSGQNQTVGILDTGVDADHPALSGKVKAEACYSNRGGGGDCLS